MPFEFLAVTLVSLFTIVNPLGASVIFSTHVTETPSVQGKRMAMKASLGCVAVLTFFAVIGGYLFQFMSVSINAFRIAGGILVFKASLEMLRGANVRSRVLPEEQRTPPSERISLSSHLPFLCRAGPGAITTVIVLMGRATNRTEQAFVLGSITTIAFATYFILFHSPRIMSLLGASGVRVMNRMMGLLLAGISVQFVMDGVTALLPEFARLAKPL